MPLSATSFVYALGRNGRAHLLWTGIPGAATFNLYRDGQPLRTGLVSNLFVDFGLTNGQIHTYAVAGVDADGNEGSHSATVSVTPAAPTATQFRYRQALGELLTWLVDTDGLPAINDGLQVQAGAGNPPLYVFPAGSVVRGQVYETAAPIIAVDVLGERAEGRYMDGLVSVSFVSQVALILAGDLGGPGNRAFVGDCVMDNLRALLDGAANSLLPALSPKTGHWTLPGCAVFKDCRPTQILRLNTPVKMENGVQRVPCWHLYHECTLEYSQSEIGLQA